MTNKVNKNNVSRLSDLPIQSNALPTNLPASDCSPPSLKENQDREEYQLIHSIEVHLTVRSKIKLTRQQACMLAGIAISDVLSEGLALKDWIVIEFLYDFLLGNKQEPFEVKDSKELELLLILKLILLSGTWMGLEKRRLLDDNLIRLIRNSRLVPNDRTKASWQQTWNLATFIEVRAVPMTSFLERQTGTQRYSGYCKGYGESSPAGKCKKTKFSSELDGEEPTEKELSLNLLSIGTILSLVFAEEQLKKQRIKP